MMRIFVYTFRTFPYIEELKQEFGENFMILGKLKEDLERFFGLITKEKPTMILGVALSNSGQSYFEPKTINRFNRNAKIIKNGKDELSLFVPKVKETPFRISQKATSSFCNYSMYKVESFLEREKLTIPFSFVHMDKKDIEKLKKIFTVQQSCKSKETFSRRVALLPDQQ